ncbi:MAG: hypothetical protein L0Z73_17095 [Gammaproteobacteria bacterium]|nr:hypothetical protein [Gammaproteobacteria bacterium]
MRYLIFFLFLTGCAVHAADLADKPRGEEVFSALLKNGSINLVNEPLCKADINLYEQLALAFSVSYESGNTTVIKSHCSPSKHEFSADNIVDVWDCTVQINENNQKGEFISSSTIVFSLTLDKKEFINGSLRCR